VSILFLTQKIKKPPCGWAALWFFLGLVFVWVFFAYLFTLTSAFACPTIIWLSRITRTKIRDRLIKENKLMNIVIFSLRGKRQLIRRSLPLIQMGYINN